MARFCWSGVPFLAGFLTALCFYFTAVEGEVFSSVADIEALIGAELHILDVLKELRTRKEHQIKAVESYIQKFGNIRKERSHAELQQMATNPIGAFHLIHHLVRNFADLQEELDARILNETMTKLHAIRSAQSFPGHEDIPGIAEAFVRLQQTYKIHPEDIISGKIPGLPASQKFTAAQCLLIGTNQAKLGQERKQSSFYKSAIEWLTIAKKLYHEEIDDKRLVPADSLLIISEILDWLQYAMYNSGANLLKVIEVSEELLKINPAYPTVKENLKFYQKELHGLNPEQRQLLESSFKNHTSKYTYDRDEFSAVCRGDRKVAKRVRPFLLCRFEHYGNPYLLLQPVKLEVAHIDPDVLLFHDVITSRQMDAVKAVGKKHIARAKVISRDNEDGQVSDSRVSKTAFMEEDLDPILPIVNRFSAAIANLSRQFAEPLQINNYGIGGHYYTHYDFFRDPDHVGDHLAKEKGDRIATLMYYLSDVEAGGATVFPKLNLTLYPEKGSAAFWWDLHRDGKGDVRTLHAGCPVLSGTKWVANKWFRENGQDVYRPCGLTKDSQPEEEAQTLLG